MQDSNLPHHLHQCIPLFAGISEPNLTRLARESRTASFAAGSSIAHQGDEATHLGVLLSGQVSASALDDAGQRQVFGKLGAGDTFNELALMTGDVVLADFVADIDSEILFVPVSLFQSIMVSEPSAIQIVSQTVTDRMRVVLADPSLAAAALRREADPYGLQLKGERPHTILVLNCGSSSVKYRVYVTANDTVAARGLVERIGIDGTRLVHHVGTEEHTRELPNGTFSDAFSAIAEALTSHPQTTLRAISDITLVAHRVVHGGENFTEGTLITEQVLAELDALSPLAPLHNPVNLAGIREMRKLLPNVPHVAVFDTAFHHTLPDYAYLYGLPYELYEKKAVRRYGFHGMSHHYACLRAAQFLKRRPGALKLVSCHLGNGSSLCAVDHGRSVDTSMGFTPAEGLIMGTRCGDVDAGVISFLERTEQLSAAQCERLLNQQSGLLGLSGLSSDLREILQAADSGNARALVALKTFAYRVRKYLGSYIAAMGGLDVVVFTGGIGQGSVEVRALALQGLECMGITLDLERNRMVRGFEEVSRITTDDSPVTVLVIPADEERMMAREALAALGRANIDHALATQEQEPFLVEVSAHHIHLTQEHVEALFGRGHRLTKHADLSQPGQFACQEQLTIVGPKGRIERVRVLGPARKYTQVEIAMTEQYRLGVHPPIRESGDIAGSPGCTLEGPGGSVTLEKGVICALRHIHMTPSDALRYGVRDKSVVRVRIEGDRELIFGDVLVRVDPSFALAMHIDTDEANAANVKTGTQGFLEEIQSEG